VNDTAPLVRSKRSHCRSKQLHLETRGGRISPSACICRRTGRICFFSAIFKN